jgi:hypothetical protein
MSFVSTFREGEAPPIDREGETYAIAKNIGYDDERDVVYTFLVCLAPRPACEVGVVDLMFDVVSSEEGGEERKYWSGRDAQEFLQGDVRHQLRAFLVEAVEYLFAAAAHSLVHMCTIDTDLPERALIKYTLIPDVLERRGYTVETDEPYHGQHQWHAERPGPCG